MLKNLRNKIQTASIAMVAVTTAIPAAAFCFEERQFVGPFTFAQCSNNSRGERGTNEVELVGGSGNDYTYSVEAFARGNGTAGGVLLDATGSVVFGVDENNSFRPCNKAFSFRNNGSREFECNDSDEVVQNIRVFVSS